VRPTKSAWIVGGELRDGSRSRESWLCCTPACIVPKHPGMLVGGIVELPELLPSLPMRDDQGDAGGDSARLDDTLRDADEQPLHLGRSGGSPLQPRD
jgi:hypothetical protein